MTWFTFKHTFNLYNYDNLDIDTILERNGFFENNILSRIISSLDNIESLKVTELISKYFQIDKEIVNNYYNEALLKQKESTSFHNFTSKIHKNYTYKQKIDILEMLWEVILINKEIHDYESNLMRRVCGLLHLKDIENGIAKKTAIKKLQMN